MRDKREFHAILQQIAGKELSAYDALAGDFDFTRFVLHRIRISCSGTASAQADFVLHVPQMIAGFPSHLFETPIRRTALEDYLTRQVSTAIKRARKEAPETSMHASFRFAQPGPHILPRSALVVATDYVEARISVELPARDGRVDACSAERVFFETLPRMVNEALIYCYQDTEATDRFVCLMEDADEIRQTLMQRGMVAFAAQGARCGPRGEALEIDEDLRTRFELPNAGAIEGLAVPTGITLILGDPRSGRRELVKAISDGVYNHVTEDGRAYVVSVPDAVRICAEPGRSVRGVDLRAFLRDAGEEAAFSTDAASANESQMASCMEALQAGAQALVFDEADSDSAFLAMDPRLHTISGGAPGRVFSLSERVRQMVDEWRVSVVVGAWACAGPFLAVADRVLWVDAGRIRDVTDAARAVETETAPVSLPPLPDLSADNRWLCPSSIDPSLGREDAVICAPDRGRLQFGRSHIDLRGVPQVADRSQTVTLGLILYYAKLHYLDTERPLGEVLDLLDQELGSEGLDALAREHRGDLARPRRFEVAAALNRLDALRTFQRQR